jgi:hypothetical protein
MEILRPGDPGDIDVPALLPAGLCANLVVDIESARCQVPPREIDREHPGRGASTGAARRRGITARVEREGRIAGREPFRLHVPPLRACLPHAS